MKTKKQDQKNSIKNTTSLASVFKYINAYKYLYLMVIPGLVMVTIFKYLPMYGILMAFKDFSFSKGILGSPWNNLLYFKQLFKSEDFYNVFYNSVLLSVMRIIFSFPAPIILAILLNEVRVKTFKRITQTIIYLPHFVSWVVLTSMLFKLLSADDGLINLLIKSLGFQSISFLGNPKWFRPIVVFETIWKEAGWNTIIYLAALTAIDSTLYEAAMVDGANRIRQIWHITLPGIAATIVVLLILAVGRAMDNGFEQIFLLQNPINMPVSDVFETYTYRMGLLKGEFSYSTAVGLFKSVVGLILITGSNFVARRLGQEGI